MKQRFGNDTLQSWNPAFEEVNVCWERREGEGSGEPWRPGKKSRPVDWKGYFQSGILLAWCALAVGSIVTGFTFFAWTLILRNDFRMTRLRIGEAMRSPLTMECGGVVLPLSMQAQKFFNMYLNNPHTTAYNRKPAPVTEETITLRLRDGTLSFTGVEGGQAVNICWRTDVETQYYTVHNRQMRFLQMIIFFNTCRREAGTG